MIELPLIFVGGLLGSAHCVGMCGPLVLYLTASDSTKNNLLLRQLVFSLGRIFTYSFCGAAAGFGGAWLAASSRNLVLSQAWLAIVAGLVLIAIGLTTAGVLPKLSTKLFASIPCGATTWLKTYLSASGWSGPLLAGMFTGLIPCGLVYAFLLKAGSSGSVWLGYLTMVCFGLGTVPLMVFVGYSARFLSTNRRLQLFQIAAWCVVLTGAISIARGANQLNAKESSAAAPCLFCLPEE